jgi:predicted nucleic acid-binding protein
MTAYLDSSVVLRHLIGQKDALRELRLVRRAVASRILEVECLRTLDRLRVDGSISEGKLAHLREKAHEVFATVEVVEVTRTLLRRAAQPTPTSLGTLDAIHLASALAWRERTGENAVFATHDQALAIAGRAAGLRVIGA